MPHERDRTIGEHDRAIGERDRESCEGVQTKRRYPRVSLYSADLTQRFVPALASRRVHDGATGAIEHFGQSFTWDATLHTAAESLEPLRAVGDPLMDAALAELEVAPSDDLLARLHHARAGTASARLQASLIAEPAWLDWKLLAEGQRVFMRYLPAISLILYNVSLVGGFSAPKITKVLEQSGYLVGAPSAVMKRLFDTGRLLIDSCAHGPDAMRAGGAGWRSAVRVRALHAHVRRRLLRRTHATTGGGAASATIEAWDAGAYGVPINQEDCAATLLAFSYNVIVGLEAIRGHPLADGEQQAYLHLWRYLGHLLGVAEAVNPCAGGVPTAKAALESIVLHILHPDALSVRISHHLLRTPYAAMRPDRAEAAFVRNAQLTRLLVGDALGDALQLPFDVSARRSARRTLHMVRAYVWLAERPLLGPLLVACHRLALQCIQRFCGEERFPMRCPGLTSIK